MAAELTIAGVGVSVDVLATIVTVAVRHVEGVVQVGVASDIASSLVSALTARSATAGPAVECVEADDGTLHVTVHLTVFYGYPFTKLAEVVREAVAAAIREQTGAQVSSVDVCIDSIVFPKE